MGRERSRITWYTTDSDRRLWIRIIYLNNNSEIWSSGESLNEGETTPPDQLPHKEDQPAANDILPPWTKALSSKSWATLSQLLWEWEGLTASLDHQRKHLQSNPLLPVPAQLWTQRTHRLYFNAKR
ncbi:hypothetical protein NDU88_001458 [Pleurodeles waltl]|uniref:Uncharacterized protein n=1 Tax=Pleurodeles waltl TaxID=8319 RepID=A0AAV7SZK8_PLEWA|nr:hypothetical protein NDU88_001458 [Pleurodeles waltl]